MTVPARTTLIAHHVMQVPSFCFKQKNYPKNVRSCFSVSQSNNLDHYFVTMWRLSRLTLALAVKNISKTLSEPFPVLDSTNSAPDAKTKGSPLSLAIARASSVFPVPGGPLIKIPCRITQPNPSSVQLPAPKTKPQREFQNRPSHIILYRDTTGSIVCITS